MIRRFPTWGRMLTSVWPRINASLCCSAFELWLPGAKLNGIGRQSVSPVRKVPVACQTLLRDCITHQAFDSTVLLAPRPPPLPLFSFRLESISMGVHRLTLCLSLCSTWFCLAEAMQGLLPTPIFAGLRAAQVDLGIKPTSAPRQHEIWKRLSGDPAICGWIEGDSGMFREKMERCCLRQDTYPEQKIRFHAIRDTPARPLRRISDVARQVLPVAKTYTQHVTTDWDRLATLNASSTMLHWHGKQEMIGDLGSNADPEKRWTSSILCDLPICRGAARIWLCSGNRIQQNSPYHYKPWNPTLWRICVYKCDRLGVRRSASDCYGSGSPGVLV